MAFPGPEKATVHQHCLVQQGLSGKSRDGEYQKGQGRKRQARPHDACILGRLQALTGQVGQVEIWSRRVLRRSLSII